GNINIIEREDSLQSIAAMSPANRDAFLKKLSKKLKKEQGIKDNDSLYSNPAANYFNSKNSSRDIFGNVNSTNGDWYFYNTALKSQGYTDFKRNWGKRQNVDNWRWASASANSVANASGTTNAFANPDDSTANNGQLNQNSDPLSAANTTLSPPPIPVQTYLSVEGLLANVPVTKEKLDESNTKVSKSLFQLGKDYQNLLEDYGAAIDAYENSLKRFPDSLHAGELYLNLSYCYRKLGDLAKSDYYK